ncbi:MAG: hypothetical protein A2Y71_10175 [Bacteroidetes bacterium RBG_13_42_15]|nr:MAG: hypothetical protein A2Y71_10175 [Bacteroidetes bacterium RBG_13_42_15]
MKKRSNSPPPKPKAEYDGDTGKVISTGSTLLDLAISGGRIRGGGIPVGILVEIFGPSGSGKTVLLSEIAGAVQRQGGQVMFHDPEARLNKQFSRMFGLDTDTMDYSRPDTVPEVFTAIRNWSPGWTSIKDVKVEDMIKQIKEPRKGINPHTKIHGIFADSLAALSTDMEMDKEGDKMGMRRAKEFSEELRKTCRIITRENYLMVCSNQVRQNIEPHGQKLKSPGGEAMSFYSSLRLNTNFATRIPKIKQVVSHKDRDVERVIGVNIEVYVFKSSVWSPYRTAPLTILFDYGIDDIRQNLQFIKQYSKNPWYAVKSKKLDQSMEKSIALVETDESLVIELHNEVIDLWEDIESKFKSNRKPKQR